MRDISFKPLSVGANYTIRLPLPEIPGHIPTARTFKGLLLRDIVAWVYRDELVASGNAEAEELTEAWLLRLSTAPFSVVLRNPGGPAADINNLLVQAKAPNIMEGPVKFKLQPTCFAVVSEHLCGALVEVLRGEEVPPTCRAHRGHHAEAEDVKHCCQQYLYQLELREHMRRLAPASGPCEACKDPGCRLCVDELLKGIHMDQAISRKHAAVLKLIRDAYTREPDPLPYVPIQGECLAMVGKGLCLKPTWKGRAVCLQHLGEQPELAVAKCCAFYYMTQEQKKILSEDCAIAKWARVMRVDVFDFVRAVQRELRRP